MSEIQEIDMAIKQLKQLKEEYQEQEASDLYRCEMQNNNGRFINDKKVFWPFDILYINSMNDEIQKIF